MNRLRIFIRLPPYAQRVNIAIVKAVKMAKPGPLGFELTPIICPHCFRRTVLIFQRDQYECPKCRVVVITSEELHNYYEDARA